MHVFTFNFNTCRQSLNLRKVDLEQIQHLFTQHQQQGGSQPNRLHLFMDSKGNLTHVPQQQQQQQPQQQQQQQRQVLIMDRDGHLRPIEQQHQIQQQASPQQIHIPSSPSLQQ